MSGRRFWHARRILRRIIVERYSQRYPPLTDDDHEVYDLLLRWHIKWTVTSRVPVDEAAAR